ncbi:Dynamin-like GTPase that mediates homotypic ER fusion, partial [Quaeritorhiza haematococci]
MSTQQSHTVPDVDYGGGGYPAKDGEIQLQLVNEHQEFSPDVYDYMKTKWHIAERGFDYNVVAVFGSQSTGKSTLLNKLFETRFDVMNETMRQQTTK